ncbi:MAG: LPS-assembly protein LptD [Blastocatellia bacterium]|nr:LPS-assembly protein LptD [Blastocatellia bacterium]
MLALISLSSAAAQQPENIEKKIADPIGAAEEEQRALRLNSPQKISIVTQVAPGQSSEYAISHADKKEKVGDVVILTGNVHVTYGDTQILADRITFHDVTKDMIAVGNVFFEQQGQRIAADRIELNTETKRGTILHPTAWTNRTLKGDVLIIDSKQTIKTGDDTYDYRDVKLTACQDEVPKWTVTAKRARIRVDHQAKIYNGLFRIKNFPIFYIPYATIPINKKDRSSGFLLPSWGSSTTNGRTLHFGYYQTLGRSADVTVRTDVFTTRGLGLGLDFRARPNENSFIDFGLFSVIDRLWGGPGPNQGGTSFYAHGVERLKDGFIAVADVNLTSSFTFRQIFSRDILAAISPEERTDLYINKNWRNFSFNAYFGEQSSYIFNQNADADPTKNCRVVQCSGLDEIVKVRQLPSFEFTERPTKISDSLPFYFSFDTALDGVSRTEAAGSVNLLKTPSVTERLDFLPRLTIQLPSFKGFTLTPTVGVRSTFYSDSIDPVQNQVVGQDLFRKYGEADLDLRLPSFSKIFAHGNGTPWFKHVIEPFVEYHLISGVDEFNRTLRIDERDVVASTNEITYGVSNSFLIRRQGANGASSQPWELLNIALAQTYYFDPTFGGALQDGVNNQFFPINTLSGFSYGGIMRSESPINLRARVRPTSTFYADLRMDYDTRFNTIRDFIIGAGVTRGKFSFGQSWYFSRQLEVDQPTSVVKPGTSIYFDPSSFPGNQVDFSAFLGNAARGPYGGVGISYDLRDRTFIGDPRKPSFINMSASGGWAWDCCSFNIQRITYNAGIRNESRFIFAFTLKGLGSIGTNNIGQRR